MSEPSHDNRNFAAALALGAAACLVFAACSRHWLVNGRADMMFGLRDNLTCGAPDCEPTTNAAFVELVKGMSGNSPEMASNAFAPMGWATTVTCLLAALGLAGAAALALAKKRPTLPISPSTIALLGIMAGLITGCVFVATKPGEGAFIGVGLGFFVFGIGSVAGIVAAQMLAKINRPPDPDLMDGAMNPDEF
jgi:hypothetical protein